MNRRSSNWFVWADGPTAQFAAIDLCSCQWTVSWSCEPADLSPSKSACT